MSVSNCDQKRNKTECLIFHHIYGGLTLEVLDLNTN